MIINEISEKGLVYGYTDNMKQICASCERKVDLGEIVPVKIIGGEEFKWKEKWRRVFDLCNDIIMI